MNFHLWLQFLTMCHVIGVVLTLSSRMSKSKSTVESSLAAILQRCYTPKSILEEVGRKVTSDVDPCGLVSSLILVRLCKQIVTLDNSRDHSWNDRNFCVDLDNVIHSFTRANWKFSARSVDAAIEGTKSASVLSRLIPNSPVDFWLPILEKWNQCADSLDKDLHPHQISGLKWSFDCFRLTSDDWELPPKIQNSYANLSLPFRIRPALLQDVQHLSISNLAGQVNFRTEQIRTESNALVDERRKTAWEGDSHIAPFEYSGKSMQRETWSPLVLQIRDRLQQRTGEYYDCCLLNLYPNGRSGMRYHTDPDQGNLWGYATAVVSVGATRRFAFRPTGKAVDAGLSNPHVFILLTGDVTEMFADCQTRYQHAVKTADVKKETAARASLVFKKSM